MRGSARAVSARALKADVGVEEGLAHVAVPVEDPLLHCGEQQEASLILPHSDYYCFQA